MDKAKLIKKSNTLVSRITVITLTFMMLVTGMQFSTMSPLVANAADAGNITTWAELEEALQAKAPTITIAEDLYADKTLEIDYAVTIEGKDGQTIFQQKRDSYDTMFKVTGGGDLTLGNNLTLTGETGCASGGGGGDDDPIQTMTLHIYEGDSSINNYYIALVPANSNTIGYEERPKAVTVEVYNDRTIKYNGNYLGRITQGDMQVYAFDSSITADNAVKLTNVSGGTGTDENPIVPVTEDTSYRLIDGTTGYLGYDANTGLIAPLGRDNSYELKAKSVKPYEDPGSGGGGSGDDQGCDDAGCPSDETYTKDTFDSGIVDATGTKPHGFFVQVEDGGTATLNGATLENFITSRSKDDTPKHVAPVAVVGEGSTFNVSSGAIKNNIVGYVVDDDMANKSADEIKRYIKGAAPNAARKGDYATKQYRRNKEAGIDGDDAGSGITGTAGAILYADGAKGNISGGDIGMNRGDTGGIMVTGEDTVVNLATGADINQNVGVQFGGGVTTENGAKIKLDGGVIKKNVAWFGGGGVYATENGVAWLLGFQNLDSRSDGMFEMYKGSVEENTAFTRGGGFFVDSDGVSLLKGTIKDNLSHMLGGGMYVMGDDPNFTYTVYINKGYVHENKAVSAGPKTAPYQDEDNLKLSQLLKAPNGCDGIQEGKLLEGYMTVNSDDLNDGYPNPPSDASDGTGGGIWLCAYGNTVLNVGDDSFIIDKNYATGSFRHGKAAQTNQKEDSTSSGKAGGNDIHKETKGSGNIVIFGITDKDDVMWYDENNGEHYTSYANSSSGAITDFSLKNLVNYGDFEPDSYSSSSYEGVDVSGNMSRRGGGLAADGTFIFGEATALGEAYSELAVKKAWKGGTVPEDVTIRISLEYKDGDTTKTIQVVELPLSETAKEGSELDTVFTEGSNTAGDEFYGHIVLPITVEDENGKKIRLFDLVSDKTGEVFTLDTAPGLLALADYLDENPNNTVSLTTQDRRLIYEELVDDGSGNLVKAADFEITPSAMKLVTDPKPHIGKKDIIYQLQTDGKYKEVGSVITSDIRFEAELLNDKPAEIEKYVNKAVHQNIAVDQEFEYDVMAYVKHGTDKLVLTDTLVKDLAFVSGVSDVKVEVLDDNNHKPLNDISGTAIDGNDNATVAKTGTAVTMGGDYKKVEIDEDSKTLTVTIANKLEEVKDVNENVIGYKNADDDQHLTDLWGKWVRVTYKAQIDPEIQDLINNGEMTVKDLHSDYVTVNADEKYKPEDSIYGKDDEGEEIYRPTPNEGNAPVESDEDHTGLENTASYSLEVKNEPSFEDESNTVTVKPDEPTVEKYVHQAVHKDIALDEVFTYDIIGYITNDADKVVFQDQLVDDLEFVDPDDIQVTFLKDNNHKPFNDVEGLPIDGNDDASVASDEWQDVPTEGLYKSASNDTGLLTVTIDDAVTVDDDGNVTDREHRTVKNLRGKYVKVTFKAQIKKSIQDEIKAGTKTLADLSSVKVKVTDEVNENDPVLSDEEHSGIKNDAKMNITVGNKDKYSLESNKVTVKPEQPEIEKYVNQAVHDFIDIDETFTYDIIAYITKDADEVTITDKLDSQLQFVSSLEDITVVDLGEDDNHKVTNDINSKKVNKDATVADEGEDIKDVEISTDGQKLKVRIANAADYRGHWVKVTFDAKIKDGLTTGDLEYTQINADAVEDRDGPNVGNAPVLSDESHDGIPNKASYTIGVKNGAEIEEKYKDESNTVTVKPKEFEIEISKQDPDGNLVAGAKLVVLDSRGVEVASWTSGNTPHKLKLKQGNYTLREAKAPAGLKTITTPIKFSVDSDGNVELKTTSVDNDGEVSASDNHIALKNAPVDTDLQKFINYDNKSQKAKKMDDTFEFRIVATVPYGVSKFEITDPIPEPLLYVEDSLQIYIDDDFIDETSAVMATEEPDYIAVSITSDDDGTMDVSEVYGKDVALVFECRIDPKADLSKYEEVVNSAYVFLNDSDKPVEHEDDDVQASVLGINDLADKDGKSKKKGANTGDNTPIELAIFGLLASAAAYAIIRRRREN